MCAWLLIWPAALMHILVMVVREAALLLLVATSPIAAGGLLSEVGRAWFWKSLRWLVAALLIAPLSALVLGVGTRITHGVLAATTSAGAAGTGQGSEAAIVGMAVVGSVLLLVGALCPLILFRLLAFVDPGTSSGAAMRSSLASHGGLSGVLKGHTSRRAGRRWPPRATAPAARPARRAGRPRPAAGSPPPDPGRAQEPAPVPARGASPGSEPPPAPRPGWSPPGSPRPGRSHTARSPSAATSCPPAGVGHAHPYYPPYPGATPAEHRQRPRRGAAGRVLGSPETSEGTPSAVVGADATGPPPTPDSQGPQPDSQPGSDDTGTTGTEGQGSGS